ncbi:hypothetical protein AAY473_006626 [Plecturocebus cupreus]
MGPAEPVHPYTPHREAPRWGTGKTAAPAKRVVLVTRVAPLPGISRSVGNKNSSEKILHVKMLPFSTEKVAKNKLQTTNGSLARWLIPVIPALWEAEADRSLEKRSDAVRNHVTKEEETGAMSDAFPSQGLLAASGAGEKAAKASSPRVSRESMVLRCLDFRLPASTTVKE